MVLIGFCVFWLIGTYVGFTLFETNFYLQLYITLPIIGLLIIASILMRRKKLILLICLCSIALFSGLSRYQSYEAGLEGNDLQSHAGTYATMQGVVAADPEARDTYTLLHVSLDKIQTNGVWQNTDGKVLVYADKYPDLPERDFPYYRYGDSIELSGQLEEPPIFEDFNYREYLERQRIYSIVYYPDVQLLEVGQGNKALNWIYTLRTSISEALNASLHEPQASMTQAILLGKRGTIPDTLKDWLAISGTMHLIAISGIHISIIAGLFTGLSAWLFGRHRPTYLLLPFIIIWLYTIISGMHPSAIRAAVMSSVFLLSVWTGRQNSSLNALALTAAVMVAVQPYVLWDLGFQLSFLAMSGIVLLSPYFQKSGNLMINIIRGKPKTEPLNSFGNLINAGISITLGAVIATMPAVAFYFGRISLVSLPATFLALPVLPLIITSGALTGIIGIFALPVAQVIGWATWVFQSYLIKVIEFFASLSFASIKTENISAAPILAFYAAIMLAVLIASNRKQIFRAGERAL